MRETRVTCYFIPQYLPNTQNGCWNYPLPYLHVHYHWNYCDSSFSVRQGHLVLDGHWSLAREEGAGEDGTRGSTPSEIRQRRRGRGRRFRGRGRRRRGRGRGGKNQAALLISLSAGGLCLGLASGASEEGDREDSVGFTPSEIRQRRNGVKVGGGSLRWRRRLSWLAAVLISISSPGA